MDIKKRRARMQLRRADPEVRARLQARQQKRYAEGVGSHGRYQRDKHSEVTYLIQDEHSRVKIGCTVNLTYRLGLLQAGNADLLRVVGIIEGNHETAMHDQFRALKIRGEWYRADDQIFSKFPASIIWAGEQITFKRD